MSDENRNTTETQAKGDERVTRRGFVQDTALVGLGAVLGGMGVTASATQVGRMSGLGEPVRHKILEWSLSPKTGGQQEFRCSLEATGTNGSDVVYVYVRKIDRDDSYLVISHVSASRVAPACTTIVTGLKGPIEGDYRKDQISVETIHQDGSVHQAPQREVKVLLTHPYQGLSPQDTLDQFLQDKAAGRWVNMN
jgi:hypothetical protein